MSQLPTIPPPGGGYMRGRVAPPAAVLADMKRRKRGLLPGLALAPPAAFDARQQGWVGAVKDQGQCGSCFPPGTLISFGNEDGSTFPIERIEKEARVCTAEFTVSDVVETFVRQYDGELLGICLLDHGHHPLVWCTPEHPFLAMSDPTKPDSENGSYVPASTLSPGRAVSYRKPGHRGAPHWASVSKIERKPYKGPVHNLEVSGWHSYVANGFGVHNCWDFSGTGMVEIAANVDGIGGGPAKFILSEQYTLDCGRNGGCGGDDNTNVLDWCQKTGLPLAADYGAYQGRRGQCKSSAGLTLHKIQEWGFADGGQGQGVTSPELIKAAIMARGCVGCAVAAGASWDGYQPGTIHHGNSGAIDHDVILVGWQDTATKTTAALGVGSASVTAADGWWWMRNSWSAGWGEDGYMRIAWGADSIGTESVWCTFGPPPAPVPWII